MRNVQASPGAIACTGVANGSSSPRIAFTLSSPSFFTAQVNAKLDIETIRRLIDELIEQLTDLEDDSQPAHTITLAVHPLIEHGEED